VTHATGDTSVTAIWLCFGYVTAIWLCFGFLVPNQFSVGISAASVLTSELQGGVHTTGIVCYAVSSLVAILFVQSKETPVRVSFTCLAVYFGLLCFTIVTSDSNSMQAYSSGHLLLATASGLLAIALSKTKVRGIHILLMGVFLEGCFTVFQYAFGRDEFRSGSTVRASGTYEGPYALHLVLVPCIPLALGLVVDNKRHISRILWMLVSVVLVTALQLTWYRGGVVATSMGILFLLFRKRCDHRILISVIAIICFLIPFTFWMRVSDLAGAKSSHRSVQSRLDLWHQAWQVFVSHPIVGVGQGKLMLSASVRYNGELEQIGFVSPQNEVLFVLAEGGVMGMVMVVVFSSALCSVLLRSTSSSSTGILAAWLALLICGMTDTFYGIGSTGYEPISCLVGMLIGVTLVPDDRSSHAIGK